MKEHIKSIFNLIEIFGKTKRVVPQTLNLENYCTHEHHHDFYCDAEKPFITF
ncbi:hypothetical protein HPE56_16480 [Maribacter sp. ANRC-HE7]|uniref:Uncharacterized protein n=1 Tax=Maribacter aquimaris TaxID=2737171 RepID=A0ABR7V3L2_9FLAO|nr:hypothetical protein [Maribacter aquimaris]MBD0779397.1 hypothetical protein [Maribacter aquimaris]